MFDHRAFNRKLGHPRPVTVIYGRPDRILGRNGTTGRIWADDVGLRFVVDVPETVDGVAAYEAARRGDLAGTMLTWSTPTNGDTWTGELRTVHEARLHHAGVTLTADAEDLDAALRRHVATQPPTITAAQPRLRVLR